MPKVEEYQVHPLGWENDPEEERFKLSTLDYLSAMTYNNYALFFKLDDAEKRLVLKTLPIPFLFITYMLTSSDAPTARLLPC